MADGDHSPAEWAGAIDLSFEVVGDAPPEAPSVAMIDGRRLPLPNVAEPAAARIASAMAAGRNMVVLGPKGRTYIMVSLAGAAAALR